jgi:Flp pilus assembly protein TadG
MKTRSNSIARSRRQRERGATAVEVGIVAPIFFLTIFGAIEFSRVAMLRNLAQDACYEAARACMVDGATETEAEASAQEVLSLLATRGAVVSINDGAGLDQESATIKVGVEIPLNQNSLVLPWLFADKSIRAMTELRTERYNAF